MTENVLCIFAHQDDEVGILTRIRWEVERGARVWCVYLTDGARNVAAGVRDAESLAVMRRVGVDARDVGFVGAPERIEDGKLPDSVEKGLGLLGAWAERIPTIDRIYALDWEGGHHDHDAAHLIALAFARERSVSDVFAYSMYNGYKRRPGWFRVTSFVPASGDVLRRRLTLREAFLPVRALASYPSQRRTWLALGPGLAIRALLRREERLRRVDCRRVSSRPHEGALLYEKMFGVSPDAVLRSMASLRERVRAGLPVES
jgi:LmbE family N-acetylglucosaminyl deacetylase